MFSNGIRMAGAAVIAVAAMMAFASGAAAQACPECEEYQLDIPEPEPEPVPEAPVVPETVAPVVGEEPAEVAEEPEKKRKPEPLPFVNPYEGLGLSQPLAFQRGDAASALTRAGFVIPMGISLLVMAGLLIRSRRQLASARGEAARNSSRDEG